MASRKSKRSPIEMTNGSPTQSELNKAYGTKMPAGYRSYGRAGYAKAMADVAAEGPWGTGKNIEKAVTPWANKQWDRTFGPATNKPASKPKAPKAIRSKKK